MGTVKLVFLATKTNAGAVSDKQLTPINVYPLVGVSFDYQPKLNKMNPQKRNNKWWLPELLVILIVFTTIFYVMLRNTPDYTHDHYNNCVFMFKDDVRQVHIYEDNNGAVSYGIEYYAEDDDESEYALVIVDDYWVYKVLTESNYHYIVLFFDEENIPTLSEIVWAE